MSVMVMVIDGKKAYSVGHYTMLSLLLLIMLLTCSYLLKAINAVSLTDYTAVASASPVFFRKTVRTVVVSSFSSTTGEHDRESEPERGQKTTPSREKPSSVASKAIPASREEEPAAPVSVNIAVYTEIAPANEREEVSDFQPFYIYTDEKSQKNHFAPSGWMGDVEDISLSGTYEKAKMGNTCLKIVYAAKSPKGWAGMYWQSPANNWGNVKGGYNLRGATALTFWARGENGGERVSRFKMGGIAGKYPDSDVAWIGPVTLTKDWTQYQIELSGKELHYINGGFCLTLLRVDNPHGCTIYLDDIRYE